MPAAPPGAPWLLGPLVAACAALFAACDEGSAQPAEPPGPVYARASAELVQIRPRPLVDVITAEANDPNAITSHWPVRGTATFKTTRDGVDVAVEMKDCRTAYGYPVMIYEGSDCSALSASTEAWDHSRGQLGSNILCVGAPGGRLYYTRTSHAPKPWSLGGAKRSDLIGRTIAVLDPDTREPLACGTITLESDAGLARAPDQLAQPAPGIVAQLAGSCLLTRASRAADAGSDAACPDMKKLADCAFVHCVADCLEPCAEHVRCLESHPECSLECVQDMACNKCLQAGQCTIGFCRKELSCAPPPTPNGPCTELRACCKRQGPLVESCLDFVKLTEDLSGDRSCYGTLYDWDFNYNFAYRSPCYPDGGAPSEE